MICWSELPSWKAGLGLSWNADLGLSGNVVLGLKALSHGVIFLATCNAIIMLLRNVSYVKYILANCDGNTYYIHGQN